MTEYQRNLTDLKFWEISHPSWGSCFPTWHYAKMQKKSGMKRSGGRGAKNTKREWRIRINGVFFLFYPTFTPFLPHHAKVYKGRFLL